MYFTFSRDNPALRERFEEGLRLIQADGSFQALLFRHFGKQVLRSRLNERRLLILENDLPEDLPAADSRFWLEN